MQQSSITVNVNATVRQGTIIRKLSKESNALVSINSRFVLVQFPLVGAASWKDPPGHARNPLIPPVCHTARHSESERFGAIHFEEHLHQAAFLEYQRCMDSYVYYIYINIEI